MVTTVRLPDVRDEPVASLTRVLALEPDGTDTFTGRCLPQLRKQVFGGQVLAQAIVAAGACLPDATWTSAAYPQSVHATFLRPALTDAPLVFHVERVRDGRTVTTRRVDVSQRGKTVFTALVAFTLPAGAGLVHSAPMPDVPAPEDLRDSIEIFQATGHPVAQFLGRTVAFSIRHVSGSLYVSTPPESTGSHDVWVRPRAPLPGVSPLVSHALAAYVSDQIMLEPALRSLGLNWSTPHLRAATMDHAMWFHRPLNVNDWLLFHLDSPSSCQGRSLGRASVYTREGHIVATAAQEGLIALGEPDDFWRIDGRAHPDESHDPSGSTRG